MTRTGKLRGFLLLGGILTASLLAYAAWRFVWTAPPPSGPAARATPAAWTTAGDGGPPTSGPLLQFVDDSGTYLAFRFRRPVDDPWSFEQLRDAAKDMGADGRKHFQEWLPKARTAEERVRLQLDIVSLYLYDGLFPQAADELQRLRSAVENDPDVPRDYLAKIVFLQGVAALRQGEVENCIECQCQGSCIFPLRREAVHQKPAGSRRAVGYFTEYLRRHPGSVEARWLLNIAYMTLGEYPDRVPAEWRVPLEPFRSEFDIGRFRDVAPHLGVNRFNQSGGAVMDDFDNDGLLDLMVCCGGESVPLAYYHNQGDGTFEDRARRAGLDGQLGGLNVQQTDIDNDGWLDLYVARGSFTGVPQRPSLLRNNRDGTFSDVTRAAGFVPVAGEVAVWADYDNDGRLDVFVADEVGRSLLFRNRGDGTFEEVGARAGVTPSFNCHGAAWGDIDNDGFPELYVSNLQGLPRLYQNNRDGTFRDATALLPGFVSAGYSCWFFDYDNDGWLDLFATCYDFTLPELIKSDLGQPHDGSACRLYRNRQGKGFDDVTRAAGLARALAPMGSNYADFDNDGWLDFYLATGSTSYSMLVPNRMFKNVGGRRFANVTTSSGTGILQKGHGVACGDWDRDGNVDLFVELGGAAPGDAFRNALFQNPGHPHHWLTVKLVGVKTNRPGVGARIKVVLPAGSSPAEVHRTVSSGSSYGGNPFQQTIGIGKATKIERLEIFWPTSGTTQVFRQVPVDGAIEVKEFEKGYRRLEWKKVPFKF